jgi:class 3 adenylate cyclase
MDMEVRKGNLDKPDERVEFGLGWSESIEIGDIEVGRTTTRPGWRWSTHIKPLVGTEWCRSRHLGFVVSGRLHIKLNTGAETELGPGDFFDIPAGHDAWVVGDEDNVIIEWSGFRGWLTPLESLGRRVLSTLVFTDIVDSTATAAKLGDRLWREVLSRHDNGVRETLERFNGREVKNTGDGFLLAFDGAARALHCAQRLVSISKGDGLAIRAGVHTGEVEWIGDDIRGVAVHEAARICELAGPDEVLVSSTTKDLAQGSDLTFVEKGEFALKGLERRRLFTLSTAL